MKTSVYLTKEYIGAAKGTVSGNGISISALCKKELPPIYGTPEKSEYAEALSRFWDDNALDSKGVYLVIDGEEAIIRSMNVPILPQAKLQSLIKNALYDPETQGVREMLYDYATLTPLLPEGGGLVLATAIDKEIIEYYKALFKNIGVDLAGIDLALPSAIRLLNKFPELNGETFIVSILQESNIASMLFVNGNYSFSNRAMLFEERGTPAAAVEISRTLSSLIQFNFAQQTGGQITKAYLCGLKEDELYFCNDMAASLEIDVKPLPEAPAAIKGNFGTEGLNTAEYFYAVGGLLEY